FFELLGQRVERFGGFVARAVIDKDDFECRAAINQCGPQSLAQFHKHVGLVVQGHDNANERIGNWWTSCGCKSASHPKFAQTYGFARVPLALPVVQTCDIESFPALAEPVAPKFQALTKRSRVRLGTAQRAVAREGSAPSKSVTTNKPSPKHETRRPI